MKKLFTLIAYFMAILVSSCSEYDDTEIWNKLSDHENRIVKLEELCRQMNTNITALQTIVNALQKNDYITNVAPVREDGKIIGYTITFAYSDTITIYHGENGQDGEDGKDGADGQNGKDGYTPKIGVTKDSDGVYYWTVDGEWLLDAKGNKIKAQGIDGSNGSNGSDGLNGTNGIDGMTPRLKIENDYWYVSYDDGATWTELGKATGEDGANGSNGDSIFAGVMQDDEYVYFNLSDGTMITLPKHDKENIQFEDLQVKAICCKNWDTNNDGELSYAEAAAVTDIGSAFRSNGGIIAFSEFKYFTGVSSISNEAFYYCKKLWKINIPESVTTIGEKAFMNCENIQSISLSKNIRTIGSSAFLNCGGELYIECNIPSGAFSSSYFTSVTFGKGVSTIGDTAFMSSKLKNVTIPDNITYIGKRAFAGCPVESVVISDGVSVISDNAFSSCSSLKTVVIGTGIVMIGEGAFQGNEKLTELYVKATVPPTLPSRALHLYGGTVNGNFTYLMPNLSIYVPNESVEAYRTNWKEYKDLIIGYDF